MTDEERTMLYLLRDIRRRQSWWYDLSSNIAGNAIFDGAVWLLSRLIRKI